MSVFAAMGVLITSATVLIYGSGHRDRSSSCRTSSRGGRGGFHVHRVVATLVRQHRGERVSPANDSRTLSESVRVKTGGLITGIIGISCSRGGYSLTRRLHLQLAPRYSGGLGSIAGVLIADYWLVRRKRLALEDLYLVDGEYRYRGGWNWAAVAATGVGCGLAWGGAFVALLKPLYAYAWFVGFFAAGIVYWALMVGSGSRHRALADAQTRSRYTPVTAVT